MPTWKRKSGNGETRFYHLCERCNDRLDDALLAEGWIFIRDGEPVSCSECSLRCALTAQGLWGDEDACAPCGVRGLPRSHCLRSQGSVFLLIVSHISYSWRP